MPGRMSLPKLQFKSREANDIFLEYIRLFQRECNVMTQLSAVVCAADHHDHDQQHDRNRPHYDVGQMKLLEVNP